MGKRFTPTNEADRRAIKLYLQLIEISKMPLVSFQIQDDGKTIIIYEQGNPWLQKPMNVDHIVNLDIPQALANGGTYKALVNSYRKPKRPLSGVEVGMATHRFLAGQDD